ncbi:MAG: hypothetical protein JWQ10_3476 [Herbaspirillum sp.]|jgi:hypothetical protein|nr:hypothetical protein [Herbaspirillum sp.]
MEHSSVKISDAPKMGHLQAFLLRQLTAIDSCPDSEFEARFNIFVLGFEEIFRSQEEKRENHDFDEVEVDRAMYVELIDIFRHALARMVSEDIYFARKIIFLLCYRLLKKSSPGNANTFVNAP